MAQSLEDGRTHIDVVGQFGRSRAGIRTSVEEHGHKKFILTTKESTAPPTGQRHAIDATAAGTPIYTTPNGHHPDADYESQKI